MARRAKTRRIETALAVHAELTLRTIRLDDRFLWLVA